MISRKLSNGILIRPPHLIDLIEIPNISCFEHLNKFHKDLRCAGCVIHRTVMMVKRHIQCLGNCVQFKFIKSRKKKSCHSHRISYRKVRRNIHTTAVFLDKSRIKRGIVGNQPTALTELQEIRQNFFDGRCADDHLITDTGQFFDLKGNWLLRIDKSTEPVRDLSIFHLDRTDLNDLIVDRGKSGGLKVKYYIGIIETLPLGIFYQFLQVIHQITFHSINNFKIFILGNRMAGLRKCLHAAMIRNGKSRHSPCFGTFQKN